jgi:integrase
MKISQKSVKRLKPPAKGSHSKVWYDDKAIGFGVRVSEAGVKAFVLNYSVAGRERRVTIGRWGQNDGWSADAAREKARRLRVKIDEGIDPLREEETARGELTLADLADDYVKDYALIHKREKSVYEDRRMLEKIILPKLGRLRVSAIGRRDIESLHNSQKRTPYQANRVLSLLSKIFTFAMGRNMRADNPAKGIPRFHEDKREAWFSVEQLQKFADALDAYPEQDAADALRLLIVTGARPHEVIGAEWPMFDLQRGVWTKASHHTKQKKDDHLPLNPSALMILRRMWEERTGQYLFPGRSPGSARTTLRNAWKQVCKAAGFATEYGVKGKRGKLLPRWKPKFRVYDFRHTFASHLVSRNISLLLVGKLLGHTQAATTYRYAHVADSALRDVTNEFSEIVPAQKTGRIPPSLALGGQKKPSLFFGSPGSTNRTSRTLLAEKLEPLYAAEAKVR